MRLGVALLLGLLATEARALAEPAAVTIGVYLRNVSAIDFETNTYNLDFDLWLRWSAPLDPPPTETFRFLNGTDLWSQAVIPFYRDAEGRSVPRKLQDGSLYQRYHVEGTFYHKFWLGTYPLDWQKFTINLEDRLRTREELVYLPDEKDTQVNPELQVPGWAVRDLENEERVTPAETRFGDLDRAEPSELSRYRFGVRLYRPARFFFLRLLPPLLMVFFTSALIFLLPPHYVDSRLAVVSTGILSEIFLQLTYTAGLPSVSISTIMDMIFNLAYSLLIVAFGVCVLTGRKIFVAERIEEELADPELDPEVAARLRKSLELRKRQLHRINTFTAIALSVTMLAGSVLMVVLMRGTQDLVW